MKTGDIVTLDPGFAASIGIAPEVAAEEKRRVASVTRIGNGTYVELEPLRYIPGFINAHHLRVVEEGGKC